MCHCHHFTSTASWGVHLRSTVLIIAFLLVILLLLAPFLLLGAIFLWGFGWGRTLLLFIPVLLEIPDDREIAEAYSRGEMIFEAVPKYRREFESLLAALEEGAE